MPCTTPTGRSGTRAAGLGWLNPYDHRVWAYDVAIAAAAARAGFDEIQFDYVRFPSDGDVCAIRYPVRTKGSMAKTITGFVRYATSRLHKLDARVSVDVFGLAATRDLGIGQKPERLARYVDAVYPMVYPSHFNPGEYGLADPNAEPGADGDRCAPLLRGRAARDERAARALAAGLLPRPDLHAA